MTIQMKKDEFDGALRIHSDQPLELHGSVTVTNLRGETVQRFIVSRQSEFRGEYTYNFAKDRQAWLDKEVEKREARRLRAIRNRATRSLMEDTGYSRSEAAALVDAGF